MSLIEEARAVRQRIVTRLKELEPLVREYEELRRAAAELGLDSEDAAIADAPAPGAGEAPEGAARSGSSRSASTQRRGSRRRSGTRREVAATPAPPPGGNGRDMEERVLAAVRDQPGQSVADYARTMNVSPTVLYRPVRELTTAGQIVKRNRQLYPNEG